MLSTPVEGHCVASKRIVEAALCSGLKAHIITVEPQLSQTKDSGKCTVISAKLEPHLHFSFLPSVFLAINDFMTSLEITARVKFFDYELVHVLNMNKESYLAAHKLRRIKKPLLTHFFHSPYVLSDDIFLVRKMALKAGLFGRRFHSYVLTVNVSMYNFLINELGIDPEYVRYVPYPIDINRFRPIRNKENLRGKYGLPPNRPIVAYVGSLDPARGVFDLVKSFRKVVTEVSNVLLFISHPYRKGEEFYENRLYDLTKKLKLEDRVAIRGPSANVEEVYNLADVVVLPFRRPYWVDPPLVLLEAMSSGAAVISTAVGAISEIITDHKNAVLTRPKDHSLLADAIIELVENDDEACKMAEKARETITKNYSYKAVGTRLLKTYDSIL